MWTLLDWRGNDLPEAYGLYETQEACEEFAHDLWEIPYEDELPEGMTAIEIQQ